MKTLKTALSLLMVLCMLLSFGAAAFADEEPAPAEAEPAQAAAPAAEAAPKAESSAQAPAPAAEVKAAAPAAEAASQVEVPAAVAPVAEVKAAPAAAPTAKAAVPTAEAPIPAPIPAGTTVDINPADNKVSTNNGTVTTNNGTVEDNYGTVTTNNGTIGRLDDDPSSIGLIAPVGGNMGTVIDNNGTVAQNLSDTEGNPAVITNNNEGATVWENYGTVVNNDGTVLQNSSTVVNNNDTIEENFSTVENNNEDGFISNNYDTVVNNSGRVSGNSGTVTNNLPGGSVAGGMVVNNGGDVVNPDVAIENNFGDGMILDGTHHPVENPVEKGLVINQFTFNVDLGLGDVANADEPQGDLKLFNGLYWLKDGTNAGGSVTVKPTEHYESLDKPVVENATDGDQYEISADGSGWKLSFSNLVNNIKVIITGVLKPEPKPDPKPDPQPNPKPEPKPEPKPAVSVIDLSAASVKCTFDLDGGTLDGETGKVIKWFVPGATVKLPGAPTKDGFTFAGWQTKVNGEKKVFEAGAKFTVTGAQSFTAQWEEA